MPTTLINTGSQRGQNLWQTATSIRDYDSNRTSYCYLLEAKYRGLEWFELGSDGNLVLKKPEFLYRDLVGSMERQYSAFRPYYPNVALIWFCNSPDLQKYVIEEVVPQIDDGSVRVICRHYYSKLRKS